MAAFGRDMRDVELVEEDGTPGASSPGGGRVRAAPGARPAGARPRRWSVAAAAVLVAGLVLGDVTLDARARAGQVALTGVPGVLAPLGAPVVELWRGHPDLEPDLVEAGEVLVGVLDARDRVAVVGLDPGTGEVRWQRQVRGPGPSGTGGSARCQAPAPPTGTAAGTPTGPGAGPVPVPVVVCVVDRAALLPGPGHGAGVPADRLLALDARTGAVLADRAVPRGTVLAALGTDVVTGHVDRHRYVHVVRTDPFGERVGWRFTAPSPLPRSHLAWTTRIRAEAGVVVVDEAHGWALAADGRVLHSWSSTASAGSEGTAQVLAGGRYLARSHLHGRWPRVRVTDLTTGRSFAVAGRPVTPDPDDGSARDRVLVAAGGGVLVAHDSRGRARWRLPGGVQGRPALVAGRLYRVGSADLSAVDARTGTPLWSTPLVRTPRTSLATDGRVAVVTRRHPQAGVVLTAYDLVDGRERWTVDLADDVAALQVSGDRLLGWTGEQVVVLGRPDG